MLHGGVGLHFHSTDGELANPWEIIDKTDVQVVFAMSHRLKGRKSDGVTVKLCQAVSQVVNPGHLSSRLNLFIVDT